MSHNTLYKECLTLQLYKNKITNLGEIKLKSIGNTMLKRDWLRGSINFFSSQSGVVLHVPLLGCVSQVFLGKRMVVYR